MKKDVIVRSLKEASACIKRFEAESKKLKEKVAESKDTVGLLNKEAEALKIAMELVLDDETLADINEKTALLKDKDLTVVREAMDLDLTKKTGSLGEVYNDVKGSEGLDPENPLHAFYSILVGNK